jgi:hypothetical protein
LTVATGIVLSADGKDCLSALFWALGFATHDVTPSVRNAVLMPIARKDFMVIEIGEKDVECMQLRIGRMETANGLLLFSKILQLSQKTQTRVSALPRHLIFSSFSGTDTLVCLYKKPFLRKS